MDKKQQPGQLNIELPEEVAEGIYSNLALINHSSSEFILDFVRVMPNLPKSKVKARIIVTPQHAKRLLSALKENIKKYEAANGKITEPSQGISFPMNYTPKAQA